MQKKKDNLKNAVMSVNLNFTPYFFLLTQLSSDVFLCVFVFRLLLTLWHYLFATFFPLFLHLS